MKISLFWICAVLATAFFLAGCKNKPAPITLITHVQKTLNGFSFNDADRMIKNFEGSFNNPGKVEPSRFAPPSSLYAFYNYDDIKKINDLITREKDTLHKSIDGVRIYLGTENKYPATGKVIYHLFIVTTIGNGPGGSHADDYDHDSQYLNSNSKFGDANQDQESNGMAHGANLFGRYPGTDNCKAPSYRYVMRNDAFNWVQERCETKYPGLPANAPNWDSSGYNTRAEWFDLCFIRGLFKAILEAKNKLSGLRIYQSKGYIDKTSKARSAEGERDVFQLFPTKQDTNKIDADFYPCIEDLGTYIGNCSVIPNTNEEFVGHIKAKDAKEYVKAIRKQISETSVLSFFSYNNGELCPLSCK